MTRFWGKQGSYVPLGELIAWVRHPSHRLSDGRSVPILIWGGAGIGKTQTIKAFCRDHSLKLKTYHPAHDVNAGEIVGKPYLDKEKGVTLYAMPDWLPKEGEPPGILFIDEINRAPADVLAGLMEPLGEGTINQSGWKLPADWSIIIAANPSEIGFEVNELDQALVDRVVHYTPGWDPPTWTAWADTAGVKTQIVDFALREGELIDEGEVELPAEVQKKLRASPRSLEYLNALYEPGMPEPLLRVVTEGLLGREKGSAFREMQADGNMVITFAEVVSDEGMRGSYDQRLADWGSTERIHRGLVQASVKRVVAGLIELEPKVAEEGSYDDLAKRVGRFLARLPSTLRTEAFEAVLRSAPQWSEQLRATTDVWLHHFADKGALLGPSN